MEDSWSSLSGLCCASKETTRRGPPPHSGGLPDRRPCSRRRPLTPHAGRLSLSHSLPASHCSKALAACRAERHAKSPRIEYRFKHPKIRRPTDRSNTSPICHRTGSGTGRGRWILAGWQENVRRCWFGIKCGRSRQSRRMIDSPDLPYSVPLTTGRRGTSFLPPNQPPVSNFASNSSPRPHAT